MRFELDFTIPTSKERMEYLKQNINFSLLTKKDLELCADYCLYGKQPEKNNTSSVDRKEIQIKTKYGSFAKQEPISLDALMESPTFDESILTTGRNIYKKVKPTIDREKCRDIPGMEELWRDIENLNRQIRLVEGKEQPKASEKVPNWDSKKLYHMKHRLVELRREQYVLKDSVFPEMGLRKNYGEYYVHPTEQEMNYPVYPCGVMREENDKGFTMPWTEGTYLAAMDIEKELEQRKKENKPYINFLDKEHIYYLCLEYYEIKNQAEKNPDSLLNNLLWTLDFYIEKADLNEQQKLIVEGKKRRLLNRDICRELVEKLGIQHQENYVSTIWNKITQLIADAAELNYDEQCCRNYEKAWKVCSCCGEKKLRDSRNFVRKAKAADGLTNRCKKCDWRKRRGEF